MLSRSPTTNIISLGTLMHIDTFTHDAYKEEYIEYEEFKEVFQHQQGQLHVEEADIKDYYHL